MTPVTLGSRCTAQDALGNRCVKDGGHRSSSEVAEQIHDASRGALRRRWI